jgi:hypothetical protein
VTWIARGTPAQVTWITRGTPAQVTWIACGTPAQVTWVPGVTRGAVAQMTRGVENRSTSGSGVRCDSCTGGWVH